MDCGGSDPSVEVATSYAIEYARRREADEATADDLLLGCLQAMARFGVVDLASWLIDLEEFGVKWDEPLVGGSRKIAYSQDAVELFDQAARIARADRANPRATRFRGPLLLPHLLVAAGTSENGLMGKLKTKYGITGATWRAALARRLAETRPECLPPKAEAPRQAEREYLSPEEAALELGVHVQTIRVYVRTGKIPALRLAGERAIRIRRADLIKVLEPLPPQG